MYGHYYQVTYGVNIFEYCTTIEDFNNELKKTYNNSRPKETNLILLSPTDFWEEINFGLTYRGDNLYGLSLTAKKEEQLLIEQTKYKAFLCDYIFDQKKICSYSDEQGIPG